MKSENREITKRPSAEQFWVCLQRYLQFDDPESKWERLLQLATKHSTVQRIKIKQAERLPLVEQQLLFAQTFAAVTEDRQHVSTVFNILLALQDIDQFAPVAFEAWSASFDKPTDSNHHKQSALLEEVERIAATENFSEAQENWLLHCAIAVPDWTILVDDGPWGGDNVRQFIIEFMLEANLPAVKTSEEILRAHDLFKQKLFGARAQLKMPAAFLPRLILLVEGATETILMPHFARLLKCDFDALAVLIVGTGGANQTSRKFLLLRDVTAVPIYAILDADAVEQVEIIKDMLRDNDRLHVWAAGDFEDTFATPVFLPQINHYIGSKGGEPLVLSDLPAGERRTTALDRAFRKRGLGDFDKIGFAKSIVGRLIEPAEIPAEATMVINEICTLARGLNEQQQRQSKRA